MSGLYLYTTHVAPYAQGPAGVHQVLRESTAAVAQLAEMAGLESFLSPTSGDCCR